MFFFFFVFFPSFFLDVFFLGFFKKIPPEGLLWFAQVYPSAPKGTF